MTLRDNFLYFILHVLELGLLGYLINDIILKKRALWMRSTDVVIPYMWAVNVMYQRSYGARPAWGAGPGGSRCAVPEEGLTCPGSQAAGLTWPGSPRGGLTWRDTGEVWAADMSGGRHRYTPVLADSSDWNTGCKCNRRSTATRARLAVAAGKHGKVRIVTLQCYAGSATRVTIQPVF